MRKRKHQSLDRNRKEEEDFEGGKIDDNHRKRRTEGKVEDVCVKKKRRKKKLTGSDVTWIRVTRMTSEELKSLSQAT